MRAARRVQAREKRLWSILPRGSSDIEGTVVYADVTECPRWIGLRAAP